MDVYRYLMDLRRRRRKLAMGLISGTSADGVSAAIAEISGTGRGVRLRVLAHRVYPYSAVIRREVFRLFDPGSSTVDHICRMNFILGHLFAEAALKLVEETGLEVGLIGSHGQTIWHSPRAEKLHGYEASSTLQIGEPAVIAGRTGIPVIADFRKADVAAGGEGAPLTPYMDYVLHRHPSRSRVLLNIGGIANLTYLPSDAEIDDVVGFDTGPGNMVIDALVSHYTGGAFTYDIDGQLASRGRPHRELLEGLLSHPFFQRRPPKTTGREEFGRSFAESLILKAKELGISLEDTVATASELTVESIARAIESYLDGVDEVYVSGGGARNLHLMRRLEERLRPTPVRPYDVLDISGEAKEAVLFALLANEHLHSTPSNIPKVTGARRRVVLGQLYSP
jgi:anhydro-N-acetylmuramic acid kinase